MSGLATGRSLGRDGRGSQTGASGPTGELERFLHGEDEGLLVLMRAGLAQFETIHPFLNGNGRQKVEDAVLTVNRLAEKLQADSARLASRGRRAGSALRVHDALKSRPILSMPEICRHTFCRHTGLSFPAASSAMPLLAELTGKRHNRLFEYGRHLAILNEDIES